MLAARRRQLRVILPALAGVALVIAVIWGIVGGHALPPRVIVMATGPEGGSYAAYGARYREILARQGLELRLHPTAGDGENLALLRDRGSGVSVAMLQAGMTTPEASPDSVRSVPSSCRHCGCSAAVTTIRGCSAGRACRSDRREAAHG